MKKLLLALITIGLLSCASSKPVNNSKKMIKGTWSLNSITHSNTGLFNIKLLNDASKQCFENSIWQFIPNNNSGIYSISKEGCSTGDRNFIFSILEIDSQNSKYDFILKPTNSKMKSETNNSGFRLSILQLTDNSMTLEQSVSYEGSPFKIEMNFTKNQ